jgi:hypothetical protein
MLISGFISFKAQWTKGGYFDVISSGREFNLDSRRVTIISISLNLLSNFESFDST